MYGNLDVLKTNKNLQITIGKIRCDHLVHSRIHPGGEKYFEIATALRELTNVEVWFGVSKKQQDGQNLFTLQISTQASLAHRLQGTRL